MSVKCNIMCDSTCDFTAEQAEERNVTILPFHYVEADKPNGGLCGDDDLFQSRSAHEFYDAIRHGAMPMTSQPSQLEFDEAFQAAYESGVPTVLFCISSALSGGYNGAVMSLDRLKEAHPDEEIRIYVVDSLHRGGRLPKGVAVIGDAFDVKALLHFNLDGSLGIRSVARGRKKGQRKLIDYYKKNVQLEDEANVCAVGDADVADEGFGVASELHSLDDSLEVLRPTIGPTIGSHVGPGMLSLVFWGNDRRKDKAVTKVKGVRVAK